jgi:hypothetical protein
MTDSPVSYRQTKTLTISGTGNTRALRPSLCSQRTLYYKMAMAGTTIATITSFRATAAADLGSLTTLFPHPQPDSNEALFASTRLFRPNRQLGNSKPYGVSTQVPA